MVHAIRIHEHGGPDKLVWEQVDVPAPADDDTIEALAEAAFGPGRFARAAFRLREGVEAEDSLSFVATDGEKIISTLLDRLESPRL